MRDLGSQLRDVKAVRIGVDVRKVVGQGIDSFLHV